MRQYCILTAISFAVVAGACSDNATESNDSQTADTVVLHQATHASEDCSSGADDDGDGLTNCFDPDCREVDACASTVLSICGTSGANCGNPVCAFALGCESKDQCSDRIDNDGDGGIDCQDAGCRGHGFCKDHRCAVDCPVPGTMDDHDADGFTTCRTIGGNAGQSTICGVADCDDSDPDVTGTPTGVFACGANPEDCDSSYCIETSPGQPCEVLPSCEDGIDNDGDGNADDIDPDCASCVATQVCGNSNVESPEACDDGNTSNLDGCLGNCSTTPDAYGRTCSGPCLETNDCGDGYLDRGEEQCDDGNATAGDGCTNCVVDSGYACDPCALLSSCADAPEDVPSVCADINECTLGTDNCDARAQCDNTVGGFTCTCPPGTTDDNGDGTVCTSIICAADEYVSSHACVPCAPGFENAAGDDASGADTSCTDVDECADGSDDCDARAQCDNTVGGFTCTCPPGTVDDNGDGTVCTSIICGIDEYVSNHACVPCTPGFENAAGDDASGANTSCTDVDECADGSDNCDARAQCDNTVGGFTCTCPPGTTDDNGDGTVCSSILCGVDEYVSNHACAPCAPGFENAAGDDASGADTSCTDIDECADGSDNCDARAQCDNTVGGFTCTCPPGTTDDNGDGTVCTSILCGVDEYVSNHACAPCAPGYENAAGDDASGPDTACTDIDECALGTDNCHVYADCTNIPGSFTCACRLGFAGDGVTSCDEICGDARQVGTEECDDGNSSAGDGCSAVCRQEAGWECTDAGPTGPSFCRPLCGDGVIAGGELCDDGNTVNGDSCHADCTPDVCGDGLRDVANEACDDGNDTDDDGCTACVIDPNYTCFEENVDSPSVCTQGCGDGLLDPGETCDDANTSNGDGCNAICRVEPGFDCTLPSAADGPSVCTATCGDGEKASIEECDDGNLTFGDGCNESCVIEFCGDAIKNNAVEGCDDGNTAAGDGCSDVCAVEPGYTCEEANPTDPSICTTVCGDGIRTVDEQCDDANADAGDGCDPTCKVESGFECLEADPLSASVCEPICGDLLLVGSEECDDGNMSNEDDCLNNCVLATCGDGFVHQSDEECDDGLDNSDTAPDACRSDCTDARCGDGVKDSPESCDEGSGNSDLDPDATCRTNCGLATCGNGSVDAGEDCDDGPDNSDTAPDGCRTTCVAAFCGDFVVDTAEECDDGNDNSDREPDTCREACLAPYCGDGVVDAGEACDDGANNSDTATGACRTNCSLEGCGNGILEPGEECDDGADNSDVRADACRTTCVAAVCGDDVVDDGEQCDDGSDNSDTRADACREDCTSARCGDGVIDPVEVCDGEDGCSDDCMSFAGSVCGNGIIEPGEGCDDGDDNGSGACSSECRPTDVEPELNPFLVSGGCDCASSTAPSRPRDAGGNLLLIGLVLGVSRRVRRGRRPHGN